MKPSPARPLIAAPVLVLISALALPALVACTPTRTRPSVGEYIDDATITTRVKAALFDDPNVKATQVNVETFRGAVQLSGFVDSEAAIRRAVEVTRNVPGVSSVKNDLRVRTR